MGQKAVRQKEKERFEVWKEAFIFAVSEDWERGYKPKIARNVDSGNNLW